MAHGTGDIWVSYKDSKDWFERQNFEDGEFRTYEGWYHQLHADQPETRQIFANDLKNWILARSDNGKGARPYRSSSFHARKPWALNRVRMPLGRVPNSDVLLIIRHA